MKKLSTVFAILLFLILAGSTQAQTLYFCEGVDSDGYPENESTTFTIPSGGGYLYFLVRMSYEVDTDEVKYIIYKVDSYGKEKYSTTIYQDTEPEWSWFWKKVTFYESGKYNIYVYDSDDNFITSATLRIKVK